MAEYKWRGRGRGRLRRSIKIVVAGYCPRAGLKVNVVGVVVRLDPSGERMGGADSVLRRRQGAGGACVVAQGLRASRLLEATGDAGVAGLVVRAAFARRLPPGDHY